VKGGFGLALMFGSTFPKGGFGLALMFGSTFPKGGLKVD
jgi:hypothetical protein